MIRKFAVKRILPLFLALVIPATSVFAQETASEPNAVQKTEDVQNQQDSVQKEADMGDSRREDSGQKDPETGNPETKTPAAENSDNGSQERQIQVAESFQQVYGDKFSLDAKVSDGSELGLECYRSDNEKAVVISQDEKTGAIMAEAVGVGKAVITITLPASGSYGETQAETTVSVAPAAQEITAQDMTVQFGCAPFKIEAQALAGTLSFTSLDETILTIDENNFAHCNKTGSAKVLIKAQVTDADNYKEAEKTITVTVKSNLAKGTFKSVENIAGGVRLTWNKIEGADGYYLYRSSTGKSPWKRIKTAVSADEISYTDTDVTQGKTRYYRVKGYASDKKNIGETGETRKNVYLVAPGLKVTLSAKGNSLKWNRVTGTSGYYVYRKGASGGSWSQMAKITEPGEIAWCDTSAGNGKSYVYTVRAYNGDSLSPCAAERGYVRVSAPAVKNWKRVSSKKYKLTWKKNTSATGYQIQYAQNATFIGAKTKTIKKSSTASYTVSKLEKKKTYYARIRAYKKVNGQTYYSAWSASGNTKSTRTTKATALSKKKKVFEIRSWAKQNMYQYDTLQGSCTDGKYAYYLLNYKKVSKCKIVKVKRSTLKVVKVSAPLAVAHGNDMTYDSDRRRLVIVHSTGKDPKALTSVNPNTLTVTESKHIKIPNKLAGGSVSDAKGATAFTGLAYSSGRKEYAVLLSHNYNFVILDSNLEPVSYVKVKKKNNYTVQGIDATDDYILVAQSPKSSKQKYNIITVYDWDGNYISKINVKKGYEIESIYHVGSKYYAGFYRSYYKTYYKNVVKKVKVKGKTKKKKVKVKYRKYQRDNYVYQITGI